MIEHRLYSIEKWEQGKKTEEKILLCSARDATMYVLQGYEVFDFHESLDMEPEYYERNGRYEIYNSRRNDAHTT
jgi:hypothetical protein